MINKIVNNEKGFTLIELIIVIVILAILIGLGIPAMSGIRRTAMVTAAEANARTIATAALSVEASYKGAAAPASQSTFVTAKSLGESSQTEFNKKMHELLGDGFPGYIAFEITASVFDSVSWSSSDAKADSVTYDLQGQSFIEYGDNLK